MQPLDGFEVVNLAVNILGPTAAMRLREPGACGGKEERIP